MPASNTVQKTVRLSRQGGCYKNVYAYCMSVLKNFHNAEDAAQNTFITAWQKLPQLADAAAFDVWLFVIA